MFYAAGDDEEFIFLQHNGSVPQFHVEFAFDNKKHFVFMIMFVPDKFSFELDELDVLSVERAGDAGVPVIVDEGEFFEEIYFFHGLKDLS